MANDFYDPQFEFVTFRTLPTEAKMRVICKMLDVLIEADLAHLAQQTAEGQPVPLLYDLIAQGRVRYQEERLGEDKWQDIARTLETGLGDCEDLASWRVAELRHAGENARHVVEHRRSPSLVLYHIKVIRGDGTIEDPSAVGGMGANHLGGPPPYATTQGGARIALRKHPLTGVYGGLVRQPPFKLGG